MIKRKLTLKSARMMNGLTAKQVTEQIGINVGTLYEYENFKSYPKVDVAQKLADIYGIKLEDINFFK
jgi:transcriptional regulator with XRE-family HTH domain